MKKKILSITFVIAGIMGTTAFAQSPETPIPSAKEQRAKCDKWQEPKQASPFDGLNLSEKQQAELKALNDSCMSKERKADADMRAKREEMEAQFMNARKEHLAKIKSILSPEQYLQFLENSYLNSMNGHPYCGKAPMARRGKHNKHNRPDKKSAPANRMQQAASQSSVE